MAITIRAERPDSLDAVQLIGELEAHLRPLYPQESRHGFSVEKLLREAVAFFVIRQEGLPAGCGGIKLYETAYGEVKRMYVRPQFRGTGLGRRMLDHLAAYARQNGVELLRLETGIYQVDAVRLYEHWGFKRIPPFGEYREDPLSIYYEKRIT